QVSLFVAEREAAVQAKADAEQAATQADQHRQAVAADRSHVEQTRDLLDEAYDQSQAGMALPPRLTETALNNTYAGKAEVAGKVNGTDHRLQRAGAALLTMLAQPATGVTLERVTAAKYYLYSNLPGSRRIRWTLE